MSNSTLDHSSETSSQDSPLKKLPDAPSDQSRDGKDNDSHNNHGHDSHGSPDNDSQSSPYENPSLSALDSPWTDRNPEPPEELLDKKLIEADTIGDTVFSKHWLFTTLMKLIEFVDGHSTNKEASNSPDPSSPSKDPASDSEDDSDLIDLDPALQDELCKLWDMSMNPEVVEFLIEFKAIDILTGIIAKSRAPRATEISVGILGNMACHDKACVLMAANTKLIDLSLLLLQSVDTPTLVETTRLLQVCLSNPKSERLWSAAIHSQTVVFTRVVFILRSSTNADLLRNMGAFVDKLMDTDNEMCDVWSNTELVEALVEAMKQTEQTGSEAYESFLHILQLISTSEAGVQSLVERAEDLTSLCLQYLNSLCADDVLTLSGRENCIGSSISILAVIFTAWSDRDHLLTDDFRLLRCLLKILEVVYLRYHNQEGGEGGRVRRSSQGDQVLVDLTEEEEEGEEPQPHSSQSEEATGGQAGQEAYEHKMIDMLYEVLQNFLLDIMAAMSELPSDKTYSSHQTGGREAPVVLDDADDNESQENNTEPEPSQVKSVPRSLDYLNNQCDHLRIQYMIYIVKDFDGETDSLIAAFQMAALHWKLERLARHIFLSHNHNNPDA